MSDAKKFFWNDNIFYLQDGQYIDLAYSPPFQAHSTLTHFRNHILSLLPHEERDGVSTPKFSKIYAPLTFDADPFWACAVKDCYFNHSYEPFTVLFYVMREYTHAFKELVDGVIVFNEKEYERVRYDFNKLWTRILAGKGRGERKGQCSPDEMIRLGSLFFILQKSCDQSKGLLLDENRAFENKWSGRVAKISFTQLQLKQYQRKISKTSMSGMGWDAFFFRYIEKTDRDTVWFFHLPNFLTQNPMDDREREFDLDSLFSLFDKIPLITNREGKFLLLVEDHAEIKDVLTEFFDFKKSSMGETLYYKKGLYMDTNSNRSPTLPLISIMNYGLDKLVTATTA